MDEFTQHPDEATLYDLVEGLLDPARENEVAQHLETCASCAAFAEAGLAGSNLVDDAREAMPADAAERMMIALDVAWRERHAPAAAPEAVTAVTPMPTAAQAESHVPDETIALSPITSGTIPGIEEPAETERRRRFVPRMRARALVPVLAIIVLGTLAGTSWLAGNEQASNPSERDEATSTMNQDSAVDSGAGTAAPASAPESAPSADEGSDSAVSAEGEALDSGMDTDPRAVERDSSSPICIATPDETKLVLPDGRIPTRIVRGPLGIYVVCG